MGAILGATSGAGFLSADSVSDDLFPGDWLLDTKLAYSQRILSQQETIVNKSQFILEPYRNGLLETVRSTSQGTLFTPTIAGALTRLASFQSRVASLTSTPVAAVVRKRSLMSRRFR